MVTKPEDILPLIEAGKPVSEQQVFEAVSYHLFRQGEPAYDGSKCVYRTEDDLKCAAGCLIPDSMYRVWMDNGSDNKPLNFHALITGPECPAELHKSLSSLEELVTELQSGHDHSADDLYGWRSDLAKWLGNSGEDYGLDVAFLRHLDLAPA